MMTDKLCPEISDRSVMRRTAADLRCAKKAKIKLEVLTGNEDDHENNVQSYQTPPSGLGPDLVRFYLIRLKLES